MASIALSSLLSGTWHPVSLQGVSNGCAQHDVVYDVLEKLTAATLALYDVMSSMEELGSWLQGSSCSVSESVKVNVNLKLEKLQTCHWKHGKTSEC